MSIDIYPPKGYMLTYEEGSFTVTATGFSGTAPSGTAYYTRIGKQVTIVFPYLSGTSNAATFGLTGIPSALNPVLQINQTVAIQNASTETYGLLRFSSGSWDVIVFPSVGWTTSSVKTLHIHALSYCTA